MRMGRSSVYLVFASCILLGVVKNWAAELPSGNWTIRKSEDPGQVKFFLTEHHRGGNSSHSSDWPVTSFPGVDFAKPGHQDVHFTLTRDAGKIDCEGFLNDGEGAGVFHFEPNPNYARAMGSLGFSVQEEQQFDMALEDVSLDFAHEMKDQDLDNLDAEKLIAFRIFRVNRAFIHDLRAEGLPARDSEKLVAFRIHGVTTEMVDRLRQAGYRPDEEMLVAMRIHGVTPEWMDQLKQCGYEHIDLEKLIAFRIHGVSPEFIGKLQDLGYARPDPDQLIAMRIHNVTPEYIAGMRARGLRDLTIDQLVNMRIHGID